MNRKLNNEIKNAMKGYVFKAVQATREIGGDPIHHHRRHLLPTCIQDCRYGIQGCFHWVIIHQTTILRQTGVRTIGLARVGTSLGMIRGTMESPYIWRSPDIHMNRDIQTIPEALTIMD